MNVQVHFVMIFITHKLSWKKDCDDCGSLKQHKTILKYVMRSLRLTKQLSIREIKLNFLHRNLEYAKLLLRNGFSQRPRNATQVFISVSQPLLLSAVSVAHARLGGSTQKGRLRHLQKSALWLPEKYSNPFQTRVWGAFLLINMAAHCP